MRNEALIEGGASRAISWGAVLAGGLMAISTEIVLALLGMGLGLVSIQPNSGGDIQTMGVGAMVWWFVSGLISLFLGGWVAGRCLAGLTASRGMLHGLLSWGFVNVFSAFALTTTVGMLIGGGFSTLQSYLQGGAPGLPTLAQRGMQQLRENGQNGQQAGRNDANDRAQLSPEDRKKAEDASKAAGTAAFLVCIALVLGAAASAFGGSRGANGYERSERSGGRQPAMQASH
jgi:hypothetical protein